MKNNLKKLLVSFLALSMLVGCSSSTDSTEATAETTEETATDESSETTSEGGLLAKIQEQGYITIGTEGTYSPNSYHDEDDNLVGFDVEVGQLVARELGVEAVFVETAWDSLFAALDSGRIDIICNEVEYSDERALKYDFSTPYTYIHGALLVLESNDDITCFEDLEGKNAAQNLSSSWGEFAESYGATLVGVDSMDQSIELLLTGRADATVNAETAFADYLDNTGDESVKIVDYTESTTSSLIPVVKGNEDLVEAINTALDNLRESGELAEVSMKYFGMDVTSE